MVGMGKGAVAATQALAESGRTVDELNNKYRELNLVMGQDSIEAIAEMEERWTTAMQKMGRTTREFTGDAILGWDQMIDAFMRRNADIGNQVSNFDQLFDIASKIVDIKQRIQEQKANAEKYDWLAWFFGGDHNARVAELKTQLDALEEERKRITKEIADKRKGEKEKVTEKPEIAPKKVKGEESGKATKPREPGPLDQGEKDIEKALTERKARQEEEKERGAKKRNWEILWDMEKAIITAQEAERSALKKRDMEAAMKAQEDQQKALNKLIQSPISPDYMVEKYARMVTAIEEMPGPEIKIKATWKDLEQLPPSLQKGIMAPGGAYHVPVTLDVTANLVNTGIGNAGGESAEGPEAPIGPLTDLIKQANDAVGANP